MVGGSGEAVVAVALAAGFPMVGGMGAPLFVAVALAALAAVALAGFPMVGGIGAPLLVVLVALAAFPMVGGMKRGFQNRFVS